MNHLKELCDDLHLDSNLEKLESGSYLLPLNESLKLEIKSLDPGTFLFSNIAPLPKVKKEELLIHLMKANLFGQGTMGFVLGLKAEENLLTLSSLMPYDMDYRAFRETLEDFANIVDYWREEVKEHVKQASEDIL